MRIYYITYTLNYKCTIETKNILSFEKSMFANPFFAIKVNNIKIKQNKIIKLNSKNQNNLFSDKFIKKFWSF